MGLLCFLSLDILKQTFQKINPQWRLDQLQITIDFECGLLPAVRKVFGGVKIVGCLFHMSQCLFRWLNQHGYMKSVTAKQACNIARTFTSLAFLPLGSIRPVAETLYPAAGVHSLWRIFSRTMAISQSTRLLVCLQTRRSYQ